MKLSDLSNVRRQHSKHFEDITTGIKGCGVKKLEYSILGRFLKADDYLEALIKIKNHDDQSSETDLDFEEE